MPETKKTTPAEGEFLPFRRGRFAHAEKTPQPGHENGKQPNKPTAPVSNDNRNNTQDKPATKNPGNRPPKPRNPDARKKPNTIRQSMHPATASTGAPPNNRPKADARGRVAGTNHPIKKSDTAFRGMPLRVIPLGGLGEIGKNMTLVEYQDDIIIIDCGFAFPGDDLPGIDYVIPDFSYVLKNREKVRGVVVTHGHEDHIGALSYLLKELNVPIYSAHLTIGLIEGKLRERGLLRGSSLHVVKSGDAVKLGCMSVEFIAVNHSIPDACGLAIFTPVGTIVHTGDFKIDYTPVDDVMIDLARFGELGKKGILALMSDSTNAERPGITPSERSVGESFDQLFSKAKDRRIIMASFSSNIHRVQQAINAAQRHNRRVVVSGRSMENVSSIAAGLGYLKIPSDGLLDIDQMRKVPDEQILIITTGSQGEPMSALTRMARGDHRKISVTSNDFIIISAMPIPGNERSVGNVINELMKLNAEVVYENTMGIHVSGHACREEIRTMIGLTKPKFFIPVHGEYKHLIKNRDIAIDMGISPSNTLVAEIGNVIEITPEKIQSVTTVPSGAVMVDGIGVGDVGSVVLRDRKLLAEDGLIVVAVCIDGETGAVLVGPEVDSRGFVYVRESEELMSAARQVCRKVIEANQPKTDKDRANLKQALRDQLGGFLYSKTRRRPVVLPIIQEISKP
jgi:ribonuclease J